MNTLTALSLVSASLFAVSAQAATVDFSAYSTPTTLGTSVTEGKGTSSAVLKNADGDTDFTYYQGFNNNNATSAATFSGVVKGPGMSSDNYLQMIAGRNSGYGRPWSQVSTTTAFDSTVSGQAMSWSSGYAITDATDVSGAIRTGLFAYNAMGASGNYDLADFQTPGESIGLAVSMKVGNDGQKIVITRTGQNGTAQYWNGTSWGGSDTSVASWTVNTSYDVTVTANTTTDVMTITLTDLDAGTVVASATSSLSDLGESATEGGLRFSTGNLDSNGTDNFSMDLNYVSSDAIPEPASVSLLMGLALGLGLWLRRRRA